MTILTNPDFQIDGIKAETWSVDVEGTPVSIDYVAETHEGSSEMISLTQFWHFGSQNLTIQAADFRLADIDEYRYYFKKKISDRFVFSKVKIVEIERHLRAKLSECTTTSATYRLTDTGVVMTGGDPVEGAMPPMPELPSLDTATTRKPTRFPLFSVEVVNETPLAKLTAVYVGLGDKRRLLYAKLIGDDAHERDFAFFRKSDTKIVRKTERIRNYGFSAQSFFFDPN